MTRVNFSRSVDRLVTGDIAPTVPGLVQIENAVASPRQLEKAGSRSESDIFSPPAKFDELTSLRRGRYATYETNVYRPTEGTVAIAQEVINFNESQPVSAVVDNDPAAEFDQATFDLANPEQHAMDASSNNTPQASSEITVIDSYEAEVLTASLPVTEDTPAPLAVSSSSAGVPEDQSVAPQELPEEAQPSGGCETFLEAWYDEASGQLIYDVLVHWDGSLASRVA